MGQLKKILYIIFTLALFITFTIKGEGGDGTLSFPPVCLPLIWLWNVMVIPLLQYIHFINYCTLGPQRRKKNHCTNLALCIHTLLLLCLHPYPPLPPPLTNTGLKRYLNRST